MLIISRIIMYYVNKKELLSLLSYVLWLAAEILVIVMLYTLINKIVLHDGRDAFVIFQRSLVFVPAILAIPYLVSYLFLGLRSKDAAINQLMEQGKTEVKTPITSLDDTLTFFDSKPYVNLGCRNSCGRHHGLSRLGTVQWFFSQNA